MPGTKHYRRRREFTYNDVPWKVILEDAESAIKRTADSDDRTRIFEEVMRGLPGRKSAPKWAKPLVNPNAKLTTPYSRYRVCLNTRLAPDVVTDPLMVRRRKRAKKPRATRKCSKTLARRQA